MPRNARIGIILERVVTRRWLLLPLLLALAACWVGPGTFYTADPTLPSPLETGAYADADGSSVEHIVRLPDGRIQFASAVDARTDEYPMTLQPLAIPKRSVWIMQMPWDMPPTPPKGSLYALVERRADGALLIAALTCEGNETLAMAAGGSVDRTTCTFPTRDTLERAVNAYVAAHDPLPGDRCCAASQTNVGAQAARWNGNATRRSMSAAIARPV